MPSTFEPRRLERLPTVLARTGMGRSWVYREIAAGRFPRPVKIGRASGWDACAIDAWIEEALKAGDTRIMIRDGGRA